MAARDLVRPEWIERGSLEDALQKEREQDGADDGAHDEPKSAESTAGSEHVRRTCRNGERDAVHAGSQEEADHVVRELVELGLRIAGHDLMEPEIPREVLVCPRAGAKHA